MNMMADSEYHWCYEGDCGPSTWGDHYENCNGMRQSPIDIVTSSAVATTPASPLNMANYAQVRVAVVQNTIENERGYSGNRYIGSRAESSTEMNESALKNNGHTVQLDVETPANGVGVLSGGPLGEDYQILQLHFHWGKTDLRGSEHTLNGQEYPLELHIVHVKKSLYNDVSTALNTGDGLAVTGFFFTISNTDNAALDPIINALNNIVSSGASLPFASSGFRLDTLISGVAPVNGGSPTQYTHYEGSLTTPTCNEAVEWINFLTPLTISSSQLAAFRTLMDGKDHPIVDNYRPPQPLNSRTVEIYN